jgi:uncharacterized membrane protein
MNMVAVVVERAVCQIQVVVVDKVDYLMDVVELDSHWNLVMGFDRGLVDYYIRLLYSMVAPVVVALDSKLLVLVILLSVVLVDNRQLVDIAVVAGNSADHRADN